MTELVRSRAPFHFTGPLVGFVGFFFFSLYDACMKALLGADKLFPALALTQGVCVLAVAFFVLGIKQDPSLLKPRRPGVVAIYVLVFTVEMTSFLYAVGRIPLADLFVIILTGPLLTLALARLVLKETLTRSQILSVVLGFAGVLTMLQVWHLFEADSMTHYQGLALIAALVNVVTFSSKNIFIRKYASQESGLALVFWGALALTVVFLVSGGTQAFDLTVRGTLIGTAAGLLVTLGVVTLNKAFALGPAGLVAPIQYVQMLWATLLGLLIWNEIPTGPVLLGAALVLAGGVALSWPHLRKRRRASDHKRV